ncbi:MAG: hypothetical protein ACE5E3_04745, partial [Mariprofundus sp.]
PIQQEMPVGDKATPSDTEQEQIQASSPDSDMAKEAEQQKKETPSKKQPAKKKSPKKKNNIQLIITIVLGTTLIITAIGAYLYFNHPELFSVAEKKKPQPIVAQQLIKPIQIMPETPVANSIDNPIDKSTAKPIDTKKEQPSIQTATTITDRTAPSASKTAEILQQRQASKTPAASAAVSASQRCKDVLASYWFRSYQLATVRMDTSVYMQLLGENLDQSEKIRTLCKDPSLVGKIVASVKSEHKPDWIRKEIDALIEADRLRKEKLEADKN